MFLGITYGALCGQTGLPTGCGMTLWVWIYSSCGALSSSGSYRSFLDCDFPFSSTLSIYSNCSIDSYLRNSYDTSPRFFSDYIWSKTIPRVLPVLLILFLKCIQPLSGQCSYLGNLILIALQVYGILDTMLLLQPDGPQLDPLRWCSICIATSGVPLSLNPLLTGPLLLGNALGKKPCEAAPY